MKKTVSKITTTKPNMGMAMSKKVTSIPAMGNGGFAVPVNASPVRSTTSKPKAGGVNKAATKRVIQKLPR